MEGCLVMAPVESSGAMRWRLTLELAALLPLILLLQLAEVVEVRQSRTLPVMTVTGLQ
jgi:hypothetical protein